MLDKFKNMIPLTVLLSLAVFVMSYINIATHSKLLSSAQSIETSKTKASFIHASFTKTAVTQIENTCHVEYTSKSVYVCYNTDPWFGYCWAPDQPGPC